jgi:hypothetical protein
MPTTPKLDLSHDLDADWWAPLAPRVHAAIVVGLLAALAALGLVLCVWALGRDRLRQNE